MRHIQEISETTNSNNLDALTKELQQEVLNWKNHAQHQYLQLAKARDKSRIQEDQIGHLNDQLIKQQDLCQQQRLKIQELELELK